MALADRLVKTEPKSKFQVWLESLTPEHHKIVTGWLNDPSISNKAIADAIRKDDPTDGFVGYGANKDTISAWRRDNVAR